MYYNIFIESNLPDPLEKNQILDYIKLSNNGDLKAREKVIIHNIKLVINEVLTKFYDTPHEKKELVSVGLIGLIKSVDTFDITKNIAFSTYATICIDNEIHTFIRNNKKNLTNKNLNETTNDNNDKDLIKLDSIEDTDSNFNFTLEKKELMLEIRKQVEMLEENDKTIIKLYFGFDSNKRYTQEEIKNILKISRSTVLRKIKKSLLIIQTNLIEQDFLDTKVDKNILIRTMKKKNH